MLGATAAKDNDCFQVVHVVDLGHDDPSKGAGSDEHSFDGIVYFFDCSVHISEVFKTIVLKFLGEFGHVFQVFFILFRIKPNDPCSMDRSNIQKVLVWDLHKCNNCLRSNQSFTSPYFIKSLIFIKEESHIYDLELEGRHEEHFIFIIMVTISFAFLASDRAVFTT